MKTFIGVFIILSVLLATVSCGTTSSQPWRKHISTDARKNTRCLAEAIHGEARGESNQGKVFVGRVVLTRLSKNYGKSICEVVYAKRQFAPKRSPSSISMLAAKKALKHGPNGVTHFHSYNRRRTKSAPFSLSNKCRFVYRVGKHWAFRCR